MQSLHHSERRRIQSPREELTLAWKSIPEHQQRYPQSTSPVSLSKEAAVQNHQKKSWTVKTDLTFWRNVLWSDETEMGLCGYNDHCCVWKKKGGGL